MSTEIQKVQQMAIELKINEMIENIVTKGGNSPDVNQAEWEKCELSFENKVSGKSFSITMPNGTILYKAKFGIHRDELKVTDFRYGSWVEKLKVYSEQVTTEKQRAEAEKAEQEKREKLAPFEAISDDEFETAIRLSGY